MNWFEVGSSGNAHLFPIHGAFRARSMDAALCGLPVFGSNLYSVKSGDPVLSFCHYCNRLNKARQLSAQMPGGVCA